MEAARGLIALGFGFLIVWMFARKHSQVRTILLVAFALRGLLAVIHYFAFPLPDSQADALMFESLARDWSKAGWGSLLTHWQSGALLHPWLLTMLYLLFGPSALMAQIFNVLLGTFIVYFVWRIALEIFGEQAAKAAGWIACFFPTLNLYSAITMREAVIVFFFLLGLLYSIKWFKKKQFLDFLGASFSLFLAESFHTGILPSLFLLGVSSLALAILDFWRRTFSFKSLAQPTVIFLLILFIFTTGWGLEKVGLFGEGIAGQQERYAIGRAAYLTNLIAHNVWDLIWQAPIRIVYFLFTPFPWMITSRLDYLGLFDALLYLVLTVGLIWSFVKQWGRKQPTITTMLYVLAFLAVEIAAFAITTSNYGTAVRHRAKFAPVLISLATGAFGISKQRKQAQRKLLFISTGLAYGGAETRVVRLATRLKLRGWEVSVVSLMPPKAYVEDLETAGIPVFSLGIRRKLPDPRPVLRLARIIRKWQPDIVHSHMVHANLLARIVRPLAPFPVLVCTAHNIDEGGRLREVLYRLTDLFCDLTTQVSQAGLERYVHVGAVPRHKIRYIPNGVDTERFKPNLEDRLKVRKELGVDGFVWLAVGRFDPQKDYPNMLQAFARVVHKHSNTILLIAGDGPLRETMENMAQELGAEKHVKFLGIRRDIPQLMNAADAYVMSSSWEGMPMVLLEASATGLPIVATDVGGNREVVLDGITGFLVPPRNPEALAEAVLRMMDLPEEKRREMGKAARKHVEDNFSLDRIVDMWEALYKELLEQKGRR